MFFTLYFEFIQRHFLLFFNLYCKVCSSFNRYDFDYFYFQEHMLFDNVLNIVEIQKPRHLYNEIQSNYCNS